MKIAFFGSSLVSAYWNGAATYYRGIIRALYERGHNITFYEPNAYNRQEHRDIPDPEWARVVVYAGQDELFRALEDAEDADLIGELRERMYFGNCQIGADGFVRLTDLTLSGAAVSRVEVADEC